MRSHRNLQGQEGSTFVILTVFMVALFGFAGLSIDVGNTYLQRKKVHEACDAAALAAVVDWASGKPSATVISVGKDYCAANGMTDVEIVSVEPGIWVDATKTFTAVDPRPAGTVPAVRVVGTRQVDMHFAQVVGMSAMNPRVESVAVAAKANAALRAVPWAVCDTLPATKCLPITLQFFGGGETNACSSSGPLSGNFGQISFAGRSGANDYQEDIINGYNGRVGLGCATGSATDTGVSWGPTRAGIDARIGGLPPYVCTADSAPPNNGRLAIIPKVSTLDVSGRKSVCITGFLVISLDGYNNSDKSVSATIIESFAGTEIDPSAPPVPGELAGIGLVQ